MSKFKISLFPSTDHFIYGTSAYIIMFLKQHMMFPQDNIRNPL